MALPTAWDVNDNSTHLSVDENGLRVNYIGCDENIKDAVIRADNPVPLECELFYFETDIIKEGIIAIGFSSNFDKINKMPGCEPDSWGYHSDDGDFFNCAIINEPYGPTFTTGDTIGCCLNFINKTAFFTKNGVNLGIALRDLKNKLYPCIGLRGGSIETNFGHKKFKYAALTDDDISDVYRAETYFILNKYDESHEEVSNLLKIDETNAWAVEASNVIVNQR
ncbi:SPRY-domain-containing protein [Gigaspora margarita]|uniref:SPRY-domain-containing protein n=1 Tax=Gigaspora margarita TaxID=4874 RepID=A0A8H4EVM8_GIGMA|nr:SPRY-domain-containing protein [Gigaspora margarita]